MSLQILIETHATSNSKNSNVCYNLSLQRIMVKVNESQTASGSPSFASPSVGVWEAGVKVNQLNYRKYCEQFRDL